MGDIESGRRRPRSQRISRQNLLRRTSDPIDEMMEMEDTMWFERVYNGIDQQLHAKVFNHCNRLVIIVSKWCLWYLFCIVCVLWTVWILRFNDWHKLRIIAGLEMFVSLLWLMYCS